MKRLFIAAHIQALPKLIEVRENLCNSLRNEQISWTKLEQMHLTFRFIGQTPLSRIDSIINAFHNASQDIQSFQIELKHIGIFGTSHSPKVIWAGIEDKGESTIIYNRLQTELANIGIPSTRENFVPHLTLGRVKNPIQIPTFQATIDLWKNTVFGVTLINELIIFESILHAKGAIHIPIEKITL
jgi:2'-5' RNA ligase